MMEESHVFLIECLVIAQSDSLCNPFRSIVVIDWTHVMMEENRASKVNYRRDCWEWSCQNGTLSPLTIEIAIVGLITTWRHIAPVIVGRYQAAMEQDNFKRLRKWCNGSPRAQVACRNYIRKDDVPIIFLDIVYCNHADCPMVSCFKGQPHPWHIDLIIPTARNSMRRINAISRRS